MISVDVLTIELDTCYIFSIGTRNSTREFTKANIVVLQIKTFSENCFFIYCSEYASGVCNLYCQVDSLF